VSDHPEGRPVPSGRASTRDARTLTAGRTDGAGVYGRLSETYDAAESVPTQLDRGTEHAYRRGWTVVATFKDDGYSAFKEISRDGFWELIAAIEAGHVDVVIVRDIDRLTRNLTGWNAFEKACMRHGVRLSAYTGGDLDLSTAEGAYYGGMETLRARRESAVKSARVREAQDREARKDRRVGGGQRWFGYTRIYANPDEPNRRKRHIVREEINPVEAEALRDAAIPVLEHGESVASIARDWTARGITPVAARQWWPTSIVGTLTSARLAGLREWQGKKYPTTQWPGIIDVDAHERLVKLFGDPARRKHVVRASAHLLSGIATCSKCGRGVPVLTAADTSGTYSAKVGIRGRDCGTAARSAGVRPIRSSSTSAASTITCRGGLRVHRSHGRLPSSAGSGACARSAWSTTANEYAASVSSAGEAASST
jgi:site-specific DNA recombinase